MGGTPGPKGTMTPGRGSVRDKLNINREDAVVDEYESAHVARQQEVRIKFYYCSLVVGLTKHC